MKNNNYLDVNFKSQLFQMSSNGSKSDVRAELSKLLSDENSDYRKILKLSNELAKFDSQYQRFVVDAKTLIHLGRDSIKDHTTALLELVKNSYDADATVVDVEVRCKNGNDLVRIADNGFGMDQSELTNNWLRIGFSGKRQSKHSNLGRRKTGEKGIGRISTDRIGASLELKTKTLKDGLIGLKLNWDEFDTEGKDIYDIDIELTRPSDINIPDRNGMPSSTGTEIIVRSLRQDWSTLNMENLYYELSALTPPFKEVKDFLINLENDVVPSFSKRVDSDFFKAAEIELEAAYNGTGPDIIYTIRDKYNFVDAIEVIKWQNLLTRVNKESVSENLRCGPVALKLLFFLREGASVRDTEFKLSDLREFLDNNAGVKIYRDNIAVKPYGFPSSQFGYDWLELAERKAQNPAGIGRGAEDYSITPNQLVGAAFIYRDSNLELSDSAAREGLVESEAFYDLRNLVLGSIKMLEAHRAKIYPFIKREKREKETTANDAKKVIEALASLEEDLKVIKDEVQDRAETKVISEPIEKIIDKLDSVAKKVEKTITDLLNWNRTLSGLATIGISSAVFGHETEGSISLFKGSTSTARLRLMMAQPDVEGAISELDKAIKHSKQVAAWGAYALTRVQREKRSKQPVNIIKTIEQVVKELKPAFQTASIDIRVEGESFYSRTYQMDIETVLINLLTNAYTAATQKSGRRDVRIHLKRVDVNEVKGYEINVSDSGPGVASEFKHRIFEPLFSTKTTASKGSKSVGTGLGLTIVRSIVTDLKGSISVDYDPILLGARFKVWFPLEK